MKTLISLSTILCLTLSVSITRAQPYHPFPDTLALWSSEGQNSFNPGWQDHIRYGLQGDTTIEGKNYKKIYALFDSTLLNPLSTYYAGIREENKKIYLRLDPYPEIVLYDFSLGVGDTLQYTVSLVYPATFTRQVTAIDSVQLLNGEYRKRFHLSNYSGNCIPDTWAEGIGSIVYKGLFSPLYQDLPLNGDSYTFSCFKQDNSVLFLNNPFCNQCFCSLLTPVSDLPKASPSLIISPNPFRDCTRITAGTTSGKNLRIKLLHPNGKLLKEYSGTTTFPLTFCRENLSPGLYFLILQTQDGSTFARKIMII